MLKIGVLVSGGGTNLKMLTYQYANCTPELGRVLGITGRKDQCVLWWLTEIS